jgi:hypothetical protein
MSINSEWFLTDSFLAQRILSNSGEPLDPNHHPLVVMVKLADMSGELTNPIQGTVQYIASEDYIIRDPDGTYFAIDKTIFDANFKRV